MRFDFSCNTVLRSLEVPRRSADDMIVNVHSTITAPVFSEAVVIFSEEAVDFQQGSLADVLLKMYRIKEVRVVFCVETTESSRLPTVRRLALHTRKAVAEGIYSFLPRPPLVCSRPLTSFDNLLSWSAPLVA